MGREELYCVIRGKVQGVSFRNFLAEKAKELDIRGLAHNRSDGSVEVIAQGSRQDLEKLLEAAGAGPEGAQVSEVVPEWRTPQVTYDAFVVF